MQPCDQPRPVSCLDLLNNGSCPVVSFGCPVLDAALAGGLRPGLCEVCGEAGTGKSQLCLQLLLQVQLPEYLGGLNGNALLMSSEKVASKRLLEMASEIARRHPRLRGHNFLDHILIRSVNTMEEQHMVLFEWVPALLANRQDNIRLVVIDSVAALLRMESTSSDRSLLSYHLHQLALQYNICIVACNQVADVIPSHHQHPVGQHQQHPLQFLSSGRLVKPALGLGWAFSITRRIVLTRDRGPLPRRFIFAMGASYCPDTHSEFCISDFGVFGTSQEGVVAETRQRDEAIF